MTTETDTTPENTDPPADETPAQEVTPGPPEDDPAEPDATKAANREAAKYRRELRATQQANETLTARLDAYETAEFGRLAAAAGATVDDLMLVTDLANLRGDDGNLSEALVETHLRELRRERPHWFGRSRRATASAAGAGQGTPVSFPSDRKSFASVLRPK